MGITTGPECGDDCLLGGDHLCHPAACGHPFSGRTVARPLRPRIVWPLRGTGPRPTGWGCLRGTIVDARSISIRPIAGPTDADRDIMNSQARITFLLAFDVFMWRGLPS